MATTSGSINTLTYLASDMIADALKRMRQLRAGGTPSAADLTDGMRLINNLLKLWNTQGLLLWTYDLIQVPQVQNQIVYELGPPNGDFPDYRPLRVMEGSFIRQTCDAAPIDIALIIWDRVTYLTTSNKSALGITNSIYYDVQERPGLQSYNPAEGRGRLFCYPAPADSTHTMFLNVLKPIQDVTIDSQTFDLPLEWYEPMVQIFMAQFADYYQVPEDRIRRLKQEGAQALEWIGNWGSQEWAPMTFKPDYRQGVYQR